MKRLIKNKKGSMMFDYFILLIVGLLVLAAFLNFLNEGEDVMHNSVKKYKNMSTTDDSNLGKFE